MSFDPARRLAAEALGTLALVATVVGSGIMGAALSDDTAVSLLANTIATGAILVVLITLFGPVSGAHFNPAVTLAFAVGRHLPSPVVPRYWAAQLAGGIAAAGLLRALFGNEA